MPQTALRVSAAITIDGVELTDELRGHLEQVVVDDDISVPAMFAITFQDPVFDVLDKTRVQVGSQVEISVIGQGGDDDPIIGGDVVTVECDYDEFGKRVVVRGYDTSHLLQPGRRTRALMNVTDTDIVRQVAQDAGLDVGELEETEEVFLHVTQANVSDWEFLTTRARAIGYELKVVAGKLLYRKPATVDDAPPESDVDSGPDARDPRTLVYGQNLMSFHARVSAADQVPTVEVRGWDDEQKQPVVATVDAGTTGVEIEYADPGWLAASIGSTKLVAADESIWNDSTANEVAKALGERIGRAFAQADGVALGNAKLRAGAAVRIGRIGPDFSGAYVLSQVRHVIDGIGYRTSFSIGRSAATTAATRASAPASADDASHRLPGVVRGVVDDVADPEDLGKVKVRYPWLDGDYVSDWAPVMQLGVGPKSGTFFLPAVGDQVLVAFEQGNVGRPIVLGGLFSEVDTPPTYTQWLDNGEVKGRGIYSRQGHYLEFWDGGDHSMAVLSTSGAEASLALDAENGKVVIQSSDAIEIKAQGELKVNASKITLEADGELVLKGAQIKLN